MLDMINRATADPEQTLQLKTILARSSIIVLSLDKSVITQAQGEGLAVLQLDTHKVVRQTIESAFSEHPALIKTIERALAEGEANVLLSINDGHFLITWTVVKDQFGHVYGIMGTISDLTAQRQMTDELQSTYERLLQREIEVRTEIGRDLHDGPVQQVAAATLEVQYVRRVAKHAPERLDEALADLEAQLRRSTQDLRTVLHGLRPLGLPENGLVWTLEHYIEGLRRPHHPTIHLETVDDLPRLDPSYETALYIIAQEAINNAKKHASPSNIWIALSFDQTHLTMTIRDDGKGFDIREIRSRYDQRGSFGLINMHERAQLIGGRCRFESQPGSGTTIIVSVPLTQQHEHRSR